MARKNDDTARSAAGRTGASDGLNPSWWLPTALGLMIAGLVWVMVYYIASGATTYPIPGIGAGNIVVGFAAIMAGFIMLTRWK